MAQCYHDEQDFESDMNTEVARVADMLGKGQDFLTFPCKKNDDHSGFIPFKDLTVERIRKELKSLQVLKSIKIWENDVVSSEMLNNIKTWGDRVVRLVVNMEDGRKWSGSGYMFKNGQKYQIKTDNNVVKTNDEVKHCKVQFFYDSRDRSNVISCQGVELVAKQPFSSFVFQPVPGILDQLEVQDPNYSPPYPKRDVFVYNEMLNNNNIDIMCCIGHPHGGIKMVSFGPNIFGTSEERFDVKGRSGRRIDRADENCNCKKIKCIKYMCKTCPGSSGSPVFLPHNSYGMAGGITHCMGEEVKMLLPDCELIHTNLNMGWC